MLFVSVSGQQYSYELQLESITNPGEAKASIGEMRDVLGVRVIKFIDTADQFQILTDLDFDVDEMKAKLLSNGITVLGEITKTNLE
jgi:hypothetical protein